MHNNINSVLIHTDKKKKRKTYEDFFLFIICRRVRTPGLLGLNCANSQKPAKAYSNDIIIKKKNY